MLKFIGGETNFQLYSNNFKQVEGVNNPQNYKREKWSCTPLVKCIIEFFITLMKKITSQILEINKNEYLSLLIKILKQSFKLNSRVYTSNLSHNLFKPFTINIYAIIKPPPLSKTVN